MADDTVAPSSKEEEGDEIVSNDENDEFSIRNEDGEPEGPATEDGIGWFLHPDDLLVAEEEGEVVEVEGTVVEYEYQEEAGNGSLSGVEKVADAGSPLPEEAVVVGSCSEDSSSFDDDDARRPGKQRPRGRGRCRRGRRRARRRKRRRRRPRIPRMRRETAAERVRPSLMARNNACGRFCGGCCFGCAVLSLTLGIIFTVILYNITHYVGVWILGVLQVVAYFSFIVAMVFGVVICWPRGTSYHPQATGEEEGVVVSANAPDVVVFEEDDRVQDEGLPLVPVVRVLPSHSSRGV